MIPIIVDTAVVVPVNICPLTDDGDFKTRETSVAYNAAGMDLVWNFVTPAGVVTQTAVTPTTGGVYDWAHAGDGMFTIGIPSSGGASINNDTEGVGYFTGYATGILPWRGPNIFFGTANAVNSLFGLDRFEADIMEVNHGTTAAGNLKTAGDNYSATRGFSGTALPAAAADAAGGLPISDAGGLDIDTFLGRLDAAITTRQIAIWAAANSSVNLSGTTVATLTNLPAITSNWLTAAGLATDAVNELRDAIWNAAVSSLTTTGSIGKEFVDGLIQIAELWNRLTDARAALLDNLNIGGNVASSAAQATAQADLDILTGTDGATLATSQGNYAPAKAGDEMDLVDAPNATAVTAIQSGLATGTELQTVDDNVDALIVTVGVAGAGLTEAGGTGDHLTAVSATLKDGAHGGTAAVLTLERIVVASATTNQPALKLTGNGSGSGVLATGGATGHGVSLVGGATSGAGLRTVGGGDGQGIYAQGVGEAGVYVTSNESAMILNGDDAGLILQGTAGNSLQVDGTTELIGAVTANHASNSINLGTGVTLADDAITASKYDETTAFPLKSADASTTALARTGADSDTLKTLSDQIDDIPTNSELATALGSADDAVLAAIAALNNISTGNVTTSVTTALTTALTEAYRSTGATGSVAQLLYEIVAHLGNASISGTTKTLKKLDKSTTAKVFTLDDATTPTAIEETT